MTTGAALALAGLAAGCAAQAPRSASAPVAADKALTGTSAAASPSASAAASTAAAPASTAPAAPSSTAAKPSPKPTTAKPSTRAAAPSQGQDVAAKAPKGVPCSARVAACVSLSKQEAWFMRDGKVVRGPVKVATGRSGHATELGTFHVYRKNRMWYSTIYNNAPMPYSVFFDGGEAFHEGSVYVRSHGCVHLSAATAEWVYSFLHIGDPVQVVR
ncbi:MAG: L,D-transpeptidase [Actinocrinis sp.]